MGRRLAWTVFAVATVISTALAGAGAQSFIEGSEDLPLAPVLEAVDEAGMVFDSPSGRIVEAFATGDTDRQEVLAFYAETLPSLGWEQLADGRYRREGERLAIDFFGADGALSVRFTLAPE
ncbi:hypothetical protein [Pacificispira sp.]|uniref:hypothetical protein n=1 Tax=Pacificispira sp. TaxID=2888761 RepID=UPI003BABCE1E